MTSTALAADYAGRFGDMDSDSNNIVTRQEFKQYFPGATEAKFTETDTNGNGNLDHNEWYSSKSQYGYGQGTQDGSGDKKHRGDPGTG